MQNSLCRPFECHVELNVTSSPLHDISGLDSLASFDEAVDQVLGEEDPSMSKIDLVSLLLSEPILYEMGEGALSQTAVSDYHHPVQTKGQPEMVLHVANIRPALVSVQSFSEVGRTDATIQHKEARPKPKRALSAYNIYFTAERKRILDSLPVQPKMKKASGRKGNAQPISFTEMARIVAKKWKTISKEEKMEYEYQAALDGERYEGQMAIWKSSQSSLPSPQGRSQQQQERSCSNNANWSSSSRTSEQQQQINWQNTASKNNMFIRGL